MKNSHRINNASIAHHLPVVSISNYRSFFPKLQSAKKDILERQVDINLGCEVWEGAENLKHKAEIEAMLELEGLKYFSTPRPRGKRGGGAAVIGNTEKFNFQKLDIHIPHKLEVVWVLAKPKAMNAQFKKIIVCSFYSPPRSRLQNKLKDHIIGTLQSLTSKYPGSGIIIGGDKNKMNINSLLSCNLKLKQIVNLTTRKNEILDVCLTNMFPYYNAPLIIPPVQPDVVGQGVPSDHWVPLCVPHTDPQKPPARQYKIIISRPLPDSKVREFGQWLTRETWDSIRDTDTPSEQVKVFERIIQGKLDKHFPIKKTKIGVGDLPYMTSELKALKRRRMKEYRKNGKSSKYKQYLVDFQAKLFKASKEHLRKNIDSLKDTNPSKAYSILKKMGAQPGELEEISTFTLPEHENLSIPEAAEKIVEHFSRISSEFPPLDPVNLPNRVSIKIRNPESESLAPEILEHEVYTRICKANKPKAGVPGDLPKKLINEFGPELAVPVTKIFNNIMNTARKGPAKWPITWKQEFGTPLQKVPDPQTEDDLRIISLTAFFSKVMEKFVVEWLMKFISKRLDPKQFGGLKGNSISHYLIELINFILYN